jgi:hypothetical protein
VDAAVVVLPPTISPNPIPVPSSALTPVTSFESLPPFITESIVELDSHPITAINTSRLPRTAIRFLVVFIKLIRQWNSATWYVVRSAI